MSKSARDNLKIRKAELADAEEILKIIDISRQYMISNGNPTQWPDGYPGMPEISNHLDNSSLYVGVDAANKIAFAFALRFGEDATYNIIEDGAWLNDEPYAAIHTVATNGQYGGCFEMILGFCLGKCRNLRIDTHENNAKMLSLLEKAGFKRCGIIYVSNKTPRIAFQYPQD